MIVKRRKERVNVMTLSASASPLSFEMALTPSEPFSFSKAALMHFEERSRVHCSSGSICAREASCVVDVKGVEKERTVVLALYGKKLGVSIIIPNECRTTVRISHKESTSHTHVEL
jgi:hypothetical protein